MLVSSQIAGLLGNSASTTSLTSTVSGLLGTSGTDVTTAMNEALALAYSTEVTDTVTFTDELKNFITENLDEDQAASLLADLSAIEQLSTLGQDDTEPTSIVNVLA